MGSVLPSGLTRAIDHFMPIVLKRVLPGAAMVLVSGAIPLVAGDSMQNAPVPPSHNRLAGATSPYLLQHQNNPVDWYSWGAEAIEAARTLDRPIFLSIGYSACHWCHVMAHESFEDPNTAALMNGLFINIKVDREERPDLDDIYMTAVQMLTGGGGWPMSVWLTPELKPFYGGTYFPPDSRYGRPSFRQVLTRLGEAWKNDRAGIAAQAERLNAEVVSYLEGRRVAGSQRDGTPPTADRGLVARAIEEATARFDRVNGGFGSAPKFPPHGGLALMLARYRQDKDENLLRMATLTFDNMARGGMYDQIGGGFHRYATDPAWQVPHFEKMLYDNALLAEGYLDAWQTTGNPFYRRITREILDWVMRDMTDAKGAFHSTLDADSEGEEGKFYVWRPEEVVAILGEQEGALFCDFYGISQGGNFEGHSIPHVGESIEAFAERRKTPTAAVAERIEEGRKRLLLTREKRVRPHLDDKVLTAWNGMMIAALARTGSALNEPRYTQAASRAASFLLSDARGADGLMRVSWRGGKVSADAFLDDQAFFIRGLVALHEATDDARWLTAATSLMAATDASFWDPVQGGYFFTPPGRTDLIVRTKNPTDGAIPSGNSAMASALITLHRLTGEEKHLKRAEAIFLAFAGAIASMPGAFHNLLGVLDDKLVSASIVSVSATLAPESARPGTSVMVEVRIDIAKGWHVNSAHPPISWLIPTRVTLDAVDQAEAGDPEYPAGKEVRLGFAKKPLSVWEGRQTIRIPLRLKTSAPEGKLEVRGTVTWQACDETRCHAKAEAPFTAALLVLAKADPS